MFERYTESARRVLFFARYECSQLGDRSIETEHLLLGLLREPRGIVGTVLGRADRSPGQISAELRSRSPFREKVATSMEIPFGEPTKRALEFAAEESDRLNHNYIGTEHLLLGLLRGKESVAGSVLLAHGLTLEMARDDIVNAGKAHPPGGGARGFGAEIDALSPGILSSTAAHDQIRGIRMFLDEIGGNSTDTYTQDLIRRICTDLAALEQRLQR